MGAPVHDIEAVRQATRLLLRSADALTDEQCAAPSRLPGWTRAEVLAHLARNADGGRGIADAAARGETGSQYPGGAEQRLAGIAAGRGQRASSLVADLRRSCDALVTAWQCLDDSAWRRVGRSLTGERTLAGWVWSRRQEVEVHHVDLDVGYDAAAWPVAFVNRGLDEVLTTLPSRARRNRAPVETRVRIDASDHAQAWVVRLHGYDATVERDDDRVAPVDGTVTGWGCDLLAWLYGRAAGAPGLTAAGDLAGLRLAEWFPFA